MAGKRAPGVEISDQLFLAEFDPEKDTFVQFQRPRRWERERLDSMVQQVERIFDAEGMRVRDIIPDSVLESAWVSVMLVECNLLNPEVEEPKALFIPGKTCRKPRGKMTEKLADAFSDVWGELDDLICEEIIALMVEFHPPANQRNPEAQD